MYFLPVYTEKVSEVPDNIDSIVDINVDTSILPLSMSLISNTNTESISESEADSNCNFKSTKNHSYSLNCIAKYSILSPDIQSMDRTTEFDHLYSQILSFIKLWSQNQIEQCNFDIQSFMDALTSYKSTLEENSFLKSSHTSLYKLCDVNIILFQFFCESFSHFYLIFKIGNY